MQGVNSSLSTAHTPVSSPASSSTSSSLPAGILPSLPIATAAANPAVHSLSPQTGGTPPNLSRRMLQRRLMQLEMMPTATSYSSYPTFVASGTTSLSAPTLATAPAYIGDTDVPNQLGGAVFSVTSSVFICTCDCDYKYDFTGIRLLQSAVIDRHSNS